ncbi:multiple epidermal growth factor-like domains protein 10 [Gigantopelta aegis]|uniref:multiple epidermal growth factor-like domains protein 10 n=1 Tax=Gigantopelta aegis TaxID=1735272 RepID=UPI001B88C286|nr:multiple epidermal growth factor-like domains protein 10 [Gigantopelta aegis]
MHCMKTCGICTDTDCVEGYFRTQYPYAPCRPCEEATVEDKTKGTFENYCPQCQTKCNRCDRSTGQCYQCAEGYSGTYCTESCPTSCRSASCQQDGTCSEGCKDGFYGDKCSKTCSTNCFNKRCHQTNGSCADGCLLGYSGEKCDIKCHGMCLDNSCDSPMGKCKEGCSRPGVYGPFCNYTCNGTCESVHCQRDAFGNALCSAECTSGKMGDHCTKDCPVYCQGPCDQTSGRCLKLCRSGYYGNDCSERCPINCLTDNCLQDNGTCTHGCKPSFYGATCSKVCSKNCGKSGCHMDPGLTCVDGCVGGWRGNYCEQKCEDNCSVCDQHSGRCSGCVEGLYGENCDSLCADRCCVCNQFTGTCMAPRAEDQRKSIDGMYMNITKPNFVLLCLIVSVIIMILVGVIVHSQSKCEKSSFEAQSLTSIHSSSHSDDAIDDSRSATDCETLLMSIESSMTSLQIPPLAEVFDDVEERQRLKCNGHTTDGSERY